MFLILSALTCLITVKEAVFLYSMETKDLFSQAVHVCSV